MSIWAGFRGAVSAVVGGLGLAYEATTRMFTALNGSLAEYNRSISEYNRSLEARLEVGRIPALKAEVKILETEIACPDLFRYSSRQVAGKRKRLLSVYEELAGSLTGEAADVVLLKMDTLRTVLGKKAAG
ncbi:hypothetical protein D9M70_533410 [compost metagenome]